MIVRKYIVLIILCLNFSAWATDGKYEYKLDLTRVVDNKVYVELVTPTIKSSEIMFYMPAMIPGTYAIEDYGRFVSNLKAFDKKGRALSVEKIGDNSWKISKANKMVRLSYFIEDTFHSAIEGPEIFQPAGTNIEEGKNFIINSSGFFGYFEDLKELEYNINIVRPENFYGSTGLIPVSTNNPLSGSISMENRVFDDNSRVDHFQTGRYDDLVDSPIMYCEPDTTVINVAGTSVLVSVYSPNKEINSAEIGESIEELLNAQRAYLGGELPVDKYAFLFYFTDEPVMSYGALEHSYSSVYYMPESGIEQMGSEIRDIAAHEFFHIVTPLNIHSEQIQYFDFNNPKMSKHLWMYEGMTEYFAANAQLKGKLIGVEEYFNVIREKMLYAMSFNDTLAFTELSLGALGEYEDQYINVYQKGALIGMSLDIHLRDLSKGDYGVQNMMADLSKEFGKNKAFKDDELFDIITALTYPEVRDFFANYVEGNKALPYKDLLAKVGVLFTEEEMVMDYSLGMTQSNIDVDIDREKLKIQNEEALDAQGKALGLKNGDVLLAMNGAEIPPLGPEIQGFIYEVVAAMKEGAPYSITVLRSNDQDEMVEVLLETEVIMVERPMLNAMAPNPDATPQQIKIRNAWLGLN